MTELTHTQTVRVETDTHRGSHVANPAMFFRRWLANPLQMGSVVPPSASLRDRIVRLIRRAADEAVVEPGAGTGVISTALLRSGLPPERLIVVEIVPDMVGHAAVIEGDARRTAPLYRRDRDRRARPRISPLQLSRDVSVTGAAGGVDALEFSARQRLAIPAMRGALDDDAFATQRHPPFGGPDAGDVKRVSYRRDGCRVRPYASVH
jgi:hypothetical protein